MVWMQLDIIIMVICRRCRNINVGMRKKEKVRVNGPTNYLNGRK